MLACRFLSALCWWSAGELDWDGPAPADVEADVEKSKQMSGELHQSLRQLACFDEGSPSSNPPDFWRIPSCLSFVPELR